MLWPEKTDEQARHLLAVAVYEIRKQLGEAVIVSRGDDLVLDPEAVATDLAAFRDAIEREDFQTAAETYAGPLLDGFHLGGSAPFDHWLEQERNAVARQYCRALEAMAEKREGDADLVGAVDAWRKLAAVDRYNSRVALRLLEALVAAGNRVGALQFARVHAALLGEEFDTEPSAEFQAAVEALQAAEEPDESVTQPAAAGQEVATVAAGAPREDSQPAVEVSAEEPATGNPTAGTEEPTTQAPVLSESGKDRGSRLLMRLAAGAVVVLALAVGVWAWLFAASSEVYIAVLPFEVTGLLGDEEREALMYGLTVETLEALSHVDGVLVPAQSAVFTLKGSSARNAVQSLGVDYLVGGTVRASRDSLRINVDLSNDRGFKEWSRQYERRRGDVFRTSEEIALAVLDEVRFWLRPPDRTAVIDHPDPVAAELFWKGRAAWLERTPGGFQRALRYYEQAVDRDPGYAEAHAAIADVYNLMGAYDYGMIPPDSAYPRARMAATRALSISPNLSDAHAALAMTTFAYDRDWAAADESFREALHLDPRNTQARHWYALFLATRGREAEAMEEIGRALALDSLSPIMHTSRARQHYFRRHYDLARTGYEKALAIDGSFFTALHGLGLVFVKQERFDDALQTYRWAVQRLGGAPPPITLALMGHAHGRAGRPDSARAALGQLEAYRGAGVYVPPEYEALVFVGLGDFDAATEDLRAAYHAGSSAAAYYQIEPILAPLGGHEPFEALCDSIGLPPADV